MRTNILLTGVLSELNETIAQAQLRFDRWMKHNESIPPDLKEVVYSAGIKYGGLTEWTYCWEKYNSTTIPRERKLLLKALGVASDPWLLQRYMISL